MPNIINWHYPTEVYCGSNSANALDLYCKQLNIKRPLIVTDAFLLTLKSIQTTLEPIKTQFPTTIFSNIKPNPTDENLTNGIAILNDHDCDGIIAIGGGSVLDIAKSLAVVGKQSLDLWALEDVGDNYLRANVNKILPCIAIPTTAGTGSEVGRAALIVDTVEKRKRFLFHPQMMPNCVILDPLLTIDLPPHLTAATGMDALAHNLEALCVDRYHPMADGIAMEGLRLIKENLPVAVKNGADIQARQNMLVAASMGATAFQKGLGAVHSLSHPIGAHYDAHHGLLNAIFMPYVLQFNRDQIKNKMSRLAAYLNLPTHDFDAVLQWLLDLRNQLNLPHTLHELHIHENDIALLANEALKDPSTPSNPRKLTSNHLEKLIYQAISGEL